MDLEVQDVRAPLGWRLDGSPIWGYQGAADGDDDGGAGDGGDGGEGDDDEDDEGGNGDEDPTARLQKALEAERAASRQAKKGLQPFTRLMRELGVKDVDELRALMASKQGEKSKDDEETRKREADVVARANKRIVSAEIRAQAAKDFVDPADAVKFLNIEDYDVDDDGEADAASIKRDLKELLREKPHLAKKGREPGLEPGARRTAPGTTDMSARIRDMAGRRR